MPFSKNTAELDVVVAYAKTVRNNLFHGGKPGGDNWDNPRRMKLLLEATIGVLDQLSEFGDLKQHYTDYY